MDFRQSCSRRLLCDCKPQLHEELGLELYSTVHRSSLGREDEVPWTECWI